MKNRVLFISTKNLDYIRNVQEIELLKKRYSSCKVIGSKNKHYLQRLWNVYKELLFTRISNFDVIWIGFAPQLVLPFFWKFRKKRIIIDFFISFYDTICFDRKIIKPTGILGKIIFLWDSLTLKMANEIICDTKSHRDYFLEEFKVKDKEYHILYLEADTTFFYPREEGRPTDLTDKFIVLYFGSILPLQGVEVILSAIDSLKEQENIHFFMIGPIRNHQKEKIPISDNITYIDWLSVKELSRHIAMSDLCLAGHFNDQIGKASRTIPGKAYIYRAMEKKIILGENPANHELFSEDENTFFVPMGDSKALAQKILLLANAIRKGEK